MTALSDPGARSVPASPGDATAPPDGARSGTRSRVVEGVIVAALLVVAVAVHRGSMGQQLVEQHGFRQTQTALTAVDFEQHGIDLLHPRVPVFGPRSEVPFEFPLFQALATVPMNLGVNVDASMRFTAMACFLLTAVLLYGLVRRVAGRIAAVGALVAFLFTPFGLLWSRASLVEYLATAGAVGFVWAGIEWRERRHWVFVALAVLAGSVAMLVKITTAVFWIVPLLLYTAAREGRGLRAWVRTRIDPGLIVAVVVPLGLGLAWTRHADAIKDGDAATRWLTSANLQDWNFGTFSQRTVAANWTTIFDRVEQLLVGRSLLVVLIVVALWWGRRQRFWLGIVLVVVLAPVTFFNLYVVHDYYLAAISPALAALVGFAAAWVWSLLAPRRWGPVAAAALAIVWLAWTIWPETAYVDRIYDRVENPYVTVAEEVTGITPAGAPVVVLGADWDPTLAYYSGRPAFMLTSHATPEVIDRLPKQGYRYVVAMNSTVDPIQVLAQWPWVGVLSSHVYVVGEHREDVDRAPVYASTAASPSDPAARRIACNAPGLALPASGSRSTLTVPSPSDQVRISVRPDLAWLPAVGDVYSRGAGELRCTGTTSIDVVLSAA